MDPRLGIATSVLSAVAAIAGYVGVTIAPRLEEAVPQADRTARIEDFSGPAPELRIDAALPRLHFARGEPVDAEFWITNLGAEKLELPLLSYFDRRERSWSGRFPSWIVEIRDERGRQVHLRARYWLEENRDRLTRLNFWTVPPRGIAPLRHPLLPWATHKPGIYTLRMALDTRSLEKSLERAPTAGAQEMLDRAPRDLYVSEPLTFIVE